VNCKKIIFAILLVVIPLGLAWAGEPNPDVPFGGVVLDVNYDYSNGSPWNGTSIGEPREDSQMGLELSLLIPLSSRFTGRIGGRYSGHSFESRRYQERYYEVENKKTYGTFSVGLRIHIGGSNRWSN